MANSSINLIGLDFDTIKQNLKEYFKNNTAFKDVDYESSNINMLMEVLAYNTYLNSYYVNMVASEMFLDSAQLRDSIVSHAKELNYTPRSFSSAQAVVDVQITPATPVSSVLIKKGTSFSGKRDGRLFTFVTDRSFVLNTAVDGVYTITDMPIYEGVYTTDSFVYGATSQNFVLSNPTIDLASLSVAVIEDNGQTQLIYTRAFSLFGIDSTSKVFFVQPTVNGQYEIKFGDNTFGRTPKEGAVVVASYITCNGELPNGIDRFISDGPIDGHTNVSVTTVSAATSGSISESIESIRFNAPRAVATQERAVTADDYKTLLQVQFPEIQSINVYGGEDEDPPQYGKVFISVDVVGSDGVPDANKNIYIDYIKTKTPLTITPEIVNPDFTYVDVNTTVRYNIGVTQKTPEEIQTAVQSAINQFSDVYLDDFEATLRYSQLVKAIDEADKSIVSNETEVRAIKQLTTPTLQPGVSKNYSISFDLPLSREFYVTETTFSRNAKHTIVTSSFVFNGNICYIKDNAGILNIVKDVDNQTTVVKSVGSVDYDTGRVTLTNFAPTDVPGGIIKIYAVPASKDIFSRKNIVLRILEQDINIQVERVRV
jgi:hypothetical protein